VIRLKDYAITGLLPGGDVAFKFTTMQADAPKAVQDTLIADLWTQFRRQYPSARSPQGGFGPPYDVPQAGDETTDD